MGLDLGNLTPQPSGGTPGGGGGGYSWQDFNNLRQQIAARNQALNVQGPDYFSGYSGTPTTWRDFVEARNQATGGYAGYQGQDRSPFSLSGGTEGLYNGKYRKANTYDQLAIAAGEAGKWWMNLPGEIAGWAGGEQAKKDWTFDANKFDLGNGLDAEDLTQIRNFAVSIPGMIPGGLFEGVEKGYEAATGAPVQERRRTAGGDWEIADYQLDWGQRAAAGLDAAIDIGGTFIGGSGKAISVGGKAIARGLAGRALDRAGREAAEATTEAGAKAAYKKAASSIDRAERLSQRAERFGDLAATSGEGLLAKAGFGKGAQFGWNIAEEAGEEFAQSYLEDFRNKEYDPNGSFDKAVQSAAWGALGGGIMHGLGAAGNAVFHKKYDEKHREQTQDGATDPQAAIEAGRSRASEFARFDERNRGFAGTTTTQAILDKANEKIKDPDKIPASASAFGTSFTDDLNIKQIRLTNGVLNGMCEMDDGGKSIEGLAKTFGTTADTIRGIYALKDTDPMRNIEEWKKLLSSAAAKSGKVRILAGRNPDTNEVGVAYVDIVDIVGGDGVQLSREAWKMLGGDVDGDRYQVYMHPSGSVRGSGYMTDRIFNETNRTSGLDDDYASYHLGSIDSNDSVDRKRLSDATTAFRDALSDAMHKHLPDGLFTKEEFGNWVNEYQLRTVGGMDDFAEFLNRLKFAIFSKTDQGLDNWKRSDIAGDVLADTLLGVHLKVTETASRYEDHIKNLTDAEREMIEESTKLVAKDLNWLRSGNNLGNVHAAEFLGLFGKRIGLNVGADLGGNSTMRQSAAIKFEAFKEQDIWFDGSLSNSQVQDRFENLLAFCFALEAVGEDVQNSIEGVFWISVIDSTMAKFVGTDGSIDLSGNWSKFQETLIQEYNSKVDDFNAVVERSTGIPGQEVLVGSKKKRISENSPMDVAHVVYKVLGDYKIEAWLPIDKSNPLRGMTLKEILEQYTKCQGVDFGPFSNVPGFGKLWKYLIKDQKATCVALQARYDERVKDIGDKLVEFDMTDVDELVDITRNDDGVITDVKIVTDDKMTLELIVEAAQYMIGEYECLTHGIGTVEGFLSTMWGREWMSGDTNRMMNVILSAKISHLYLHAVNLFVAKPDNWQNDLEIELRRLAFEGGTLEYEILADFLLAKERGEIDLGLLRLLQDLDVRYDEKCKIWDQANRNNEGVGPLLAELFSSGNKDVGTSVFTDQLKKSKRSLRKAAQLSTSRNLATLGRINHSSLSDSKKVEALKVFMTDAYTTTSTKAIAAFVGSQVDIVKGMVDKGVAPKTSDIIHQMRARIVNGGLFSSLESIDLGCGSMTIGKLSANRVQLFKVLLDPEVTIRAYEPETGQYVWVNRDTIFSAVLGDNWKSSYNPDTQWEPWNQLFQACPSLVSLATPTHLGVVTKDMNSSVDEGEKVTLDKAMENYDNYTKDVNSQFMRVQTKNQAFHIAMGDPNWWSVIAADPRIVNAGEDEDMSKIVAKVIDDNLEWALTVASHDPHGLSYYEKVSALSASAVDQMFDPVRKMVRDADTQRAIMAYSGSFSSEISSRMVRNGVQFIMDQSIAAALDRANLGIVDGKLVHYNDIDINNILSKYQQGESLKSFVKRLSPIEAKRFRGYLEPVYGNRFGTVPNPIEVVNDKFQSFFQTMQKEFDDLAKTGQEAVQGMFDAYLGNVDDSTHLMYALLNMVDPNLFKVPEYLRMNGHLNELEAQLSVYEQENQGNADAETSISQVRKALSSFDDGGAIGFVSFVMGKESAASLMDFATGSDDVITQSDVVEMSKEEFKKVVHHICDKYNFNESRGKIDKDIDKAYEIENEAERIRRLNNIRNYYNQITVEYLLKNIAPSGNVYNLLAPKQTMEAYGTMFGLADRLRVELEGKLEPSTRPITRLNIDYGDPVSSCMSQHIAMNAASGSITTGIGLDGSMLNLIGGLGLIEEMEPIEVSGEEAASQVFRGWDFEAVDADGNAISGKLTAETAKQVRGLATVRVSKDGYIGDALQTLINFIQEPLHLREKKSMGAIKAFADAIETDKSMYSDLTYDDVQGTEWGQSHTEPLSAREYLLGAVRYRREQVYGHLMRWFNSEQAEELHFSDRHAKMFSNIMVNLVEVRVEPDPVNGVPGGVYYVSASALSSDEAFLGKGYDFGLGPGKFPPYDKVIVRPVAMGLQEVSEKIIRNVADHYYAEEDSGKRPTDAQVYKWANDAMSSFDDYSGNTMTVLDFLKQIQGNPVAVDNAMLTDMQYSARALWNDRRTGALQAVMTPRETTRREISESDWAKIRSFNSTLVSENSRIGGAISSDYFDTHQIVAYTDDTDYGFSTAEFNGARTAVAAKHLPDASGTTNVEQRWDKDAQKNFYLVEMYTGNDIDNARKAYNAASRRNHPILIPSSLAVELNRQGDGSMFDMMFSSTPVMINGESYISFDPFVRRYAESFRRENMSIGVTEMDPGEINIAMGTRKKLGLPDAGHLTHPDFKSGKLYSDVVEVTPTKILKRGFGAVSLVTDLSEITSIDTSLIDFSYYEHNGKNKDIGIYRNNVVAYIDNMRSLAMQGATELPKVLNNVKQNGCVGLIKQAHSDGTFSYAPLFYDGAVAKTAQSVVVNEMRSGHIRISFATENVDYNGNESMKLDLYGVAYKSVGTTATSEDLRKWAAINNCGFDAVYRADHMFDENSISSRLFELGDTVLHNNLVYFTRKVGINAFFKKVDGNWVKRDDLHSDMTDVVLRDLILGSPTLWERVCAGTLHVFSDVKVNERFSRAAADAKGIGVPPHLLFNTARVKLDEGGNLVFQGLERRNFDPHAVFKYWNTDDFLALWNHLDNRLCPAVLGEKDDFKTVFDARGRMADNNTESGNPERVSTFVGPNFYSGEGTAIADASRSATHSNQHIIKSLLRDGLYKRDVRGTVDALSVAVGRIDRAIPRRTTEEQIKHWRSHIRSEAPYVNEEALEKAKLAISDPLYMTLIDQRKDALNEKAEDLYSPLLIVESQKNQKPAKDNEFHRETMETSVRNLNEALGNPSRQNALTMNEVVMLVRLITGFTTNANGGIKTITIAQFEDAVNQMIRNINQHGRVIIGGKYDTRGDVRASIPLMPRGLATRLAATPLYQSRFGGNVDEVIEDQMESLQASVDFIKTIENAAKKNELLQFADAMCLANGKSQISDHLIDGIYMHDVVNSVRKFGLALEDVDPDLIAKYDENVRLNDEWVKRVMKGMEKYKTSRVYTGNGQYEVVMRTGEDNRTIVTYILRQLAATRRAMGLTYLEMPLSNMLDRTVGQTTQGWAFKLGRMGIGPYRVTQRMNEDLRETIVKDPELRKFWSAMREAQMLGVDRELLTHIYNGESLDGAIKATLKEQGKIEQFSNKLMNVASGKDFGIEKQIQNFLDRFWQRAQTEAPYWLMKMPGEEMTLFERQLLNNPVKLMTDIFSGKSEGKAADILLARQCMNHALAGDMAQKNLVSAYVGELAKRSAAADFALTTLVTPYFQYSTNRLGKVLNTVAPISTLHYVATKFFTEGVGGTMKILPWSETTFQELGLDEVNVKASLREAIWCDMCHMGGALMGMFLASLALTVSGILEPPEDDDKKGNFEEWTFFGMRVNAEWWIEDSLGIALPLACFWASALRGEPRVDLIVNGMSHYLGNNPVAKVADAAAVLFDPMAELYREYDQDLEGYAKAMGGPPDVWQILKGKTTSFGLSYVSQFMTPGVLKEFYRASEGNEPAYKRVFETDATGKLTMDARDNNRTMYTSYEDATLRKFTKDNPVMGFLADIIMHPETGYMNHEMPDRIIYDPEQMNSIQAFSIYEDPYTKQYKKSAEEQYATALMVIATLQSNSVEDLVKQGFMIDYDTKSVVGQVIWDMIATENAQWADLEQNGALSYYNAGYGSYDDNVRVISEMRECHKAYIQNLKDLYHNKLWSDELYSVAMYNQKNTEWAQDVHGDWYATGFEPDAWPINPLPVKFAPGESPGPYQEVMSRENDWQTMSIVSGNPTGQRALVPVDMRRVEMPDKPSLESYSDDGTNNGHSELYGQIANSLGNSVPEGVANDDNKKNPNGGGTGYGRRSGGGGGGGGRSGGSGYTPNTSAPSVRAPVTSISLPRTGLSKVNPSRIMGTDRLVEPNEQYLRPDFETKGSREAYKRSDI